MIKLRPYQEKIINDVRTEFLKGNRHVMVQLSTGGGKTLLAGWMIREALARGIKAIFLVHKRELVNQTSLALKSLNIDFGVVANGFTFYSGKRCYICSVGTLVNRLRSFTDFNLVFMDEGHHTAAKTWQRCWNALFDSFIVGLSGTPCRLDGKGLDDYYDSLVCGPSTQELIDQGSLSQYRYYAPAKVNLEGVRKIAGDYQKSELENIMDNNVIVGDAIKHYRKFSNGKSAIVFCVSIQHSKNTAEAFNLAGISARHIDGKMTSRDRDAAISYFKEGWVKVLTNCQLVSEGFDIPLLNSVILLRPTASLSLHLQMVGRALRPHPGKKEAIILDHASNFERHGLPSDPREWTLEGRKRESKDFVPSTKVCDECLGVIPSQSKSCPLCGHIFTVVKPREIEEVEGDLEEIDPQERVRLRKKEVSDCKSYDELVALGKSRGYRYPDRWASYTLAWRRKNQYG